MIPRKRIDIRLTHIALGFLGCFLSRNPALISRDIESQWDNSQARDNLVCLSVRSGFDALLGALRLPHGSEVLMSAVNIADMVRIVEAHGLVAVPVDLDPQTLEVTAEALTRKHSTRLRMLVVAHLFGARTPMAAAVDFCSKNNVLLIEDCAQAYTGDAWRGDLSSDVTLFSFGPVKTSTALGGAVLGFRDQELLNEVRRVMAKWPVQKRLAYAARLLKYALMIPFCYSAIFGLLVRVCRWTGSSHEGIVSGAVRGFSKEEFFVQIRQKPSVPLLGLLHARLAEGVSRSAIIRARRGNLLRQLLTNHIGANAAVHAHWLFPIVHDGREDLINHLAVKGFDAALRASSINVIPAPNGHSEAEKMASVFKSLVYVPAHEGMSEEDVKRLASEISGFS